MLIHSIGEGFAVDVFFILAGLNLPTGVTVSTTLNISIDGQHETSFSYDPSISKDTDYQYNSSIFSASNLKDGQHTIVLSASHQVESLLLFDSLQYT